MRQRTIHSDAAPQPVCVPKRSRRSSGPATSQLAPASYSSPRAESLVTLAGMTCLTASCARTLISDMASGCGSTLLVDHARVMIVCAQWVCRFGGSATIRSGAAKGTGMGPTLGHNQFKEPFRDQFVLFLKEVLLAFATTTPGYAHDKRSRWAYAFSPMPDGDTEKPVYATMAALRAPNLSALRVGVTEGGQVVVEVEHRKLVTPYITNDVEDPKEFPKIQKGLRQIIEHFERMAGIARHNLFDRFASHPGYRELAEQRLTDARP